MNNCFNYAKANYMMNEADYPYTAVSGTCKFNASKATKIKVASIVSVTANNANAHMTAL